MADKRATTKNSRVAKTRQRASTVRNAGKGQLTGFLDFIRTQGVVGLAVGLAIGTAAGDTVRKLVEGFINPVVQFIVGSSDSLTGSVWTRDLSRALAVSDRLFAGTVSVNTVDALSAMTPFGGMKQSGFGRDLSLHSFDKYSALKTTWIKY